MDNVKIFHMADAHLDAPFSSLSPDEAALARRSLRSALAAAVVSAKRRGVQLFLISGDLFDGEYVTPDTRDFLLQKLGEYEDIRFFICPGNHDPYGENSPYRSMAFSDNVHVFTEKGFVEVEELGVRVYGAPFTSAVMEESPFDSLPAVDKSYINIFVCHGDVGASSSPYGPVTLKEIGDSGFDYVALGHIHKPTGVLWERGVCYAYSGCIEGRGFDEAGDRGALVGSVGKDGVSLDFVSLARRKYEVETVDISGMEDRAQVVEAIRAVMRRYGNDTHLRIILTGTALALFTVSAEMFETGGSNPVSVEIKDKSVPMPRLTEAEKQSTLRGVFLRRMEARLAELPEDSEEYAVCVKALRIGLAALDGRDISGV
ncbi:MAG: DNA repair exonuclease [Clostridia bacterium]|nr:DNA repair exonuclease [Clostridia bacterium]